MNEKATPKTIKIESSASGLAPASAGKSVGRGCDRLFSWMITNEVANKPKQPIYHRKFNKAVITKLTKASSIN